MFRETRKPDNAAMLGFAQSPQQLLRRHAHWLLALAARAAQTTRAETVQPVAGAYCADLKPQTIRRLRHAFVRVAAGHKRHLPHAGRGQQGLQGEQVVF